MAPSMNTSEKLNINHHPYFELFIDGFPIPDSM